MTRSEKKSKAVSARYPATCPACGAVPFAACRTARTGRVTDTHLARIGLPADGTP